MLGRGRGLGPYPYPVSALSIETESERTLFDMETSMAATDELTVLFVDLVNFTALTDVHGDLAGADAASALVAIAVSHLDDETRLVKTLGDRVPLTTATPQRALQTAAAIVEGLHDLDDGFDARVGAHLEDRSHMIGTKDPVGLRR